MFPTARSKTLRSRALSLAAAFALAVVGLAVMRPADATTPEPAPVIVITVDKTSAGSDGWVKYSDNTRQWINPTCRQTLEAAGMSVEILDWPEINAIPDRPALDCADIPTTTPTNPTTTTTNNTDEPAPVIVITADKTSAGSDGWVKYSDNTRQWINPTCRQTLEAAGMSVEILDWPEINAIPDRPALDCADIPTTTPTNPTTTTTSPTDPTTPSTDDPDDDEPDKPDSPLGSGVNLDSGEYACVQQFGIFEHSVPDAQIADQLVDLGVETVRLPLNEHCWLGAFGYIPDQFEGDPYQTRVEAMVNTLNQRGITVILDLHWSAASGEAQGQQKMADATYSTAFWSSVASRFATNEMVLFDAYNEPHDISWPCWRDGCVVDGWQTVGMQDLVTAIRATGAQQPIILSGLDWAGDLRGWLAHVPSDPAHNLMAGFHVYNRIHVDGQTYQKRCVDEGCWTNELLPIVEAGYPVIASEVGQDVGLNTCAADFVDRFYNWADQNDVPYTAWTYNPHGCGAPSLITSWDGTLSNAGASLASHLD